MTDTKQPEALRLAEMIEDDMSCISDDEIAKELRRLHEVSAELLEALKAMCQSTIEDSFNESAFVKANAAIAKATGESK